MRALRHVPGLMVEGDMGGDSHYLNQIIIYSYEFPQPIGDCKWFPFLSVNVN